MFADIKESIFGAHTTYGVEKVTSGNVKLRLVKFSSDTISADYSVYSGYKVPSS